MQYVPGWMALFAGSVFAIGFISVGAGIAQAKCPWIVQPHVDGGAEQSGEMLVSIVFDGVDESRHFFYGFTVTDVDLAWDLATEGTLPDLGSNSRSLDMVTTSSGQAFKLSAESIEPHAVYLVMASARISEFERLNAAITPSRPFQVSYAKTRGATDMSGPLPRRSLPGVEIRSSRQDNDVNRWLTLLENEMDGDQKKTFGEQDDNEKVLELGAVDPAYDEQGDDPNRHEVQICAYQVAS